MQEEVRAFAKKGRQLNLQIATRGVRKLQRNDYVGLEGEFKTIDSLNIPSFEQEKKLTTRHVGYVAVLHPLALNLNF